MKTSNSNRTLLVVLVLLLATEIAIAVIAGPAGLTSFNDSLTAIVAVLATFKNKRR